MSDIEQAVNKYTAQVIENTLDAVKKTIDLYTDKTAW
jgi:hypothetical protein